MMRRKRLDFVTKPFFFGSLGRKGSATGKALVVEQFEQRGEALAIATVGRCREKQLVFEMWREGADRQSRIDSVAYIPAAARGPRCELHQQSEDHKDGDRLLLLPQLREYNIRNEPQAFVTLSRERFEAEFQAEERYQADRRTV
jgi:hypothetical protein